MNTHRESGVKFMSPVSLPNLRFPENHLIRVCGVCVCVCVLLSNKILLKDDSVIYFNIFLISNFFYSEYCFIV